MDERFAVQLLTFSLRSTASPVDTSDKKSGHALQRRRLGNRFSHRPRLCNEMIFHKTFKGDVSVTEKIFHKTFKGDVSATKCCRFQE